MRSLALNQFIVPHVLKSVIQVIEEVVDSRWVLDGGTEYSFHS